VLSGYCNVADEIEACSRTPRFFPFVRARKKKYAYKVNYKFSENREVKRTSKIYDKSSLVL